MRSKLGWSVAGLWLLATLWLSVAQAVNLETYQFDDPAKEQLFRDLIGELRCPKCQNQAIADSDAPLAKDLRDRTYEMVQQGASKQDVIDFMVARYGAFAHYQPPLTAATLVLWVGPLLVILGGLMVLVWRLRQQPESAQLSAEEQVLLAQLQREQTGSKDD